ncbi:MAG: succinate dehydrogenase/fumarate reductase flavoprotein subunit [Herpetosiphon sp.]
MMITHDVIVVGSGLAGMRAAIEIRRKAPGADIAIVTKLYPTRAQSGAAQGGIAAALGNVRHDTNGMEVAAPEGEPGDEWLKHLYDTANEADFLGDQDAQEILCREAAQTVYELEHMGVPFSRLPDGRIAQRSFDGHSAPRTCYAADRTGHMILHTLYGELVRYNVKIYPEWYMLGLAIEGETCRGITALDIRSGEVHAINAKATMFATGGYGRAFRVTSHALSSTGDGLAAAYRSGIPLEDMEFVQFHPMGLYGHGILLPQGARGEGGYLLNERSERFMSRYAPGRMELAPRDVVTRAMLQEIEAGRGTGANSDAVMLDVRHLGRQTLQEQLPELLELAQNYLGVDPAMDLVPIQPTAHYGMGGIPTDADGRVIVGERQVVHGFFAAGECACASVHGANRLGSNSLLEATVFGRRTGQTIATFLQDEMRGLPLPFPPRALQVAEDEINDLLSRNGRENAADIRKELQSSMLLHAGVFRTASTLEHGLGAIESLRERFGHVALDDKSRRFNTDLVETLELSRLLEFSECVVAGALARTESRGAHVRRDFQHRDDARWTRHTLAYRDANGRPELEYKPVRYGPDGPRVVPEGSQS